MKKITNKVIVALSAVLAVCSLSACGGTPAPKSTPSPTPEVNRYIAALEDVSSVIANVEKKEGQLPVKAVVAAGVDGENIARNSIDGNIETRWTGAYGPSWIMYDMGESVTVKSIEMAMWHGEDRVYPFVIEVSDDAETWTPVTEKIENKNATDDFETYEITSPKAGRYIRYNGDGSTMEGKQYCHILEIRFFG